MQRALRLADAVLTPTHAVATGLHSPHAIHLPLQVLPLAAASAVSLPLGEPVASARPATDAGALARPFTEGRASVIAGVHSAINGVMRAIKIALRSLVGYPLFLGDS